MRPAHRLTTCAIAAFGLLALLALPGAAAAKDRNHDRIPDRWEKRHRLSTNVNQAQRDQDRDHMRNRAEFLAGDNPRDRDSDDDGVTDGNENAGTIQSFDPETGKLAITLFGGDTLSGIVNDETEIKCPAGEEEATVSSSGEGSNSSGEGDNSGEEEPGDDSGDDEGSDSSSSGSEHGDEGGDSSHCTTAALAPGATVEEADVRLANGAATFEQVELAG